MVPSDSKRPFFSFVQPLEGMVYFHFLNIISDIRLSFYFCFLDIFGNVRLSLYGEKKNQCGHLLKVMP